MFGLLKRLPTQVDATRSTSDPWALSDVEQLIDDVGVFTHDALEYIEESVMEWLGEAYMPEGIADGDKEEKLQHHIEAWLEVHNERRETSVYGLLPVTLELNIN